MRISDWSSDVCSSDRFGREAFRGFTLSVLLEACGRDVAGLRDAAILSLGYDAGLRVSELVAVAVELMEAQEDGSGLLEVPHSKTDQEGQGAWVWLSPDTMRRVALWREAASIRAGALFRRVAVIRTKPREARRSEEHTSELQSLMRISYAVFCLKKKNQSR